MLQEVIIIHYVWKILKASIKVRTRNERILNRLCSEIKSLQDKIKNKVGSHNISAGFNLNINTNTNLTRLPHVVETLLHMYHYLAIY